MILNLNLETWANSNLLSKRTLEKVRTLGLAQMYSQGWRYNIRNLCIAYIMLHHDFDLKIRARKDDELQVHIVYTT